MTVVLHSEADEYRPCPECQHRWSEHGEGHCVEGCDCVNQPVRAWAAPMPTPEQRNRYHAWLAKGLAASGWPMRSDGPVPGVFEETSEASGGDPVPLSRQAQVKAATPPSNGAYLPRPDEDRDGEQGPALDEVESGLRWREARRDGARSRRMTPDPGESALALFSAVKHDEGRLALGLPTLEAALEYARENGLLGWEEDIFEYVYALREGKGLNRPLGGS